MGDRKTYLLISLATGYMDGFYYDKNVGEMALSHLRSLHPTEMWNLVDVISNVNDEYIPDHLFYANRKVTT